MFQTFGVECHGERVIALSVCTVQTAHEVLLYAMKLRHQQNCDTTNNGVLSWDKIRYEYVTDITRNRGELQITIYEIEKEERHKA